MSSEQTNAIVLRCVEFSETSLIVTLMTKDFGRLSALAKGGRRPKGPFEGALDLMSVCRVVVIRKHSDALDLLTEAKLHRRFRCGGRSGGGRRIDRLYAGYAVIELLRLLTDDDEPHQDIYDLTIQTLGQIDGDGNVAATLLYFETQLLRMLGHNPALDRCTDCGDVMDDNHAIDGSIDRTLPFSLEAGGLVCQECRGRQRTNVMISPAVAASLRLISDAATVLPVTLRSEIYPALRNLVDRYVQTVAGRRPKMQSFSPHKLNPTTEPHA